MHKLEKLILESYSELLNEMDGGRLFDYFKSKGYDVTERRPDGYPPKEEVKVETPKQPTFTQEQLDNIIKTRLEAEKNKYEKKLQEEEKQKAEILKQKQLEEAKTKQDLEKIMQERLSEKEKELLNYKTQIKKEKVDNSILSIANREKSINAQQVVALLKDEVRYTDDGSIEVVDNNSNVRYN